MSTAKRTFTDRDLDRLARLAIEADRLEGLEPEPLAIAHAPGAARAWSGRRLVSRVLATAAIVALGAAVISQFVSPATPTHRGGSGGVLAAGQTGRAVILQPAQAARDSGEDTVILAVFHDPLVGTRCVSWRDYDFDGNKCLTDVSEKELRGLCLRSAGLDSCGEHPRQVMLVALAGPRHSLPESDSSAQQLADCILSGERMCDSAGACYVPAARGCVPKNVSFRIETVGLGG